MIPERIAFGILVTFLCACGGGSSLATSSANVTIPRCIEAGGGVDSAFAVKQARRALSPSGTTFEPRVIQPIRDEGIEVGLIVSLASVQPRNVVGGGGLVWVDLESGCAIVLRRYE